MQQKVVIGTAYYPEHWPRDRWQTDIDLMQAAGISAVRVAELAWSRLEPEEGHYDFTWLDDFIDMGARAGLKFIIGTPTEATPVWLRLRYPESVATGPDRELTGSRGNNCHNHRALSGIIANLVEAMAQHYGNHPAVIGWQIDNELRAPKCYCPQCLDGFRDFLRARYGTIEALNEAWGTVFWAQEYRSFADVQFPYKAETTTSPCQSLDSFRFASRSTVEHLNRQARIIRRYAPEQFITHNSLGVYPWLDLYDLAKELDFIGFDSYPNVDDDNFHTCFGHDHHRGVKQGPYWVMEQKNGYFNYSDYNLAIEPGLVRLWGWQGIARGADGVLYYRWRSGPYGREQNPNGILNHEGKPRRAYYEAKQVVEELEKLPDLVGSPVVSPVAVVFQYDQEWGFDAQHNYPRFGYTNVVKEYHEQLLHLGLCPDVTDMEADWSRYQLVVAPATMLMKRELRDKMEDYARAGGHLVLTMRSGIKTWSGVIVTDGPYPGLLADLAGIRIDEFEVLPPDKHNTIEYKGQSYDIGCWVDMIDADAPDTEVLATYTGKFYAGKAAVTRRPVGQGWVQYVGVMENPALTQTLLADMTDELGIQTQSMPQGLFLSQRRTASGLYSFYLNFADQPRTAHAPQGVDVLRGGAVKGEVTVPPLDLVIVKS